MSYLNSHILDQGHFEERSPKFFFIFIAYSETRDHFESIERNRSSVSLTGAELSTSKDFLIIYKRSKKSTILQSQQHHDFPKKIMSQFREKSKRTYGGTLPAL